MYQNILNFWNHWGDKKRHIDIVNFFLWHWSVNIDISLKKKKEKSKNFSWFVILFGLKFTPYKVNATSS